jgi:hypothetical protein
MAELLKGDFTHLSVFALDYRTGQPITRMPVYAEVSVTVLEESPVAIDGRFEELIGSALSTADPDCYNDANCRARLTGALAEALARALTAPARDRLGQEPDFARNFFVRVFRLAGEANAPLNQLDDAALKLRVDEAVRTEADRRQLGVMPPPQPSRWSHPLGVLGTDHVGYLSFDLTRLPPQVRQALASAVALRRKHPQAALETNLMVYPLALEAFRFDALAQGRFAHDAVLIKLEMPRPELTPFIRNLGLLAMQKPGLTDWRISPGSFATNPGTLIGADGCESLLPASVALQEFQFYQVIRLVDPAFRQAAPDDFRAGIELGVVQEYNVSWFHLGHSLGQILYSLPLAPGESVNLAVVDWTRRDDAQRQEVTKLDEQIVHNEHRDRVVTETVNAAIKEYQKGSSFMAGLAESSGIAGTIGKFGVASGLAGALGGSSSDSSGARDLAANTVQNLSDNISQASTAHRELQSTVVVHSVQAEREAIETRTVVNYNHSHALTILYYEVLRHFRVVTRAGRRRPAVLAKIKTDWFEPANVESTVLSRRALLEGALINPKLAEGFNAAERIAHRRELAQASAGTPPPPGGPGDRRFAYFTFEMRTGGFVSDDPQQHIDIRARLVRSGGSIILSGADPSADNIDPVLNPPGSLRHEHSTNIFSAKPIPVPVKWNEFDAIDLDVWPMGPGGSDVSFTHVKVIARDTDGSDEVLVDQGYEAGHLVISARAHVLLPVKHPPPAPAPPSPPAEINEDAAKAAALFEHLHEHKAHYSRILTLAQNPADRARELEKVKFSDGTTLLDRVENRPLEVLGDYVAHPCSDWRWTKLVTEALERRDVEEVLPDERLVTLPTRGVFAEAKLGHCNASEEIDNTRFWDWQQSPIPHFAPEIAPVQPVTPQPQQPNLAPTPFPQSLVNIVTPPAAPDPTGLAAALTAITAPNVFRDMSHTAEVGDLLKRLSDNTIGIVEAANKARGIIANQAARNAGAGASAGGGGASPAGSIGGTGAQGAAGSTAGGAMPPKEQHERMQVVRNAVAKNEITPDAGKQKIEKILDSGTEQKGEGSVSLDANSPEARSFFPPDVFTGETVLIAEVKNVDYQGRTAWLDPAPGGGSVIMHSPGPTAVTLRARRPGVCSIQFAVSPPNAAKLTASTLVSVPVFVEVGGDLGDINAVTNSWQLASRTGEILSKAESVASELARPANLRLVWTVAAAGLPNTTLPEHFAPGGAAREFLSRVVLADTSASGEFLERQTNSNYPASIDFAGTSTINLGELVQHPLLGSAVTALIARLLATPPDPAVQDFAVTFFSRILGAFVVQSLCALLLAGPSEPPGGTATFVQRTGFDLPSGLDAGSPSSYIDRGVAAMQLAPSTVELLQKEFPVPPAFK